LIAVCYRAPFVINTNKSPVRFLQLNGTFL
jgi:hypothetical protein